MSTRLVAPVMGLLILAACGTSPPVNFHTLSIAGGAGRRPSPGVKSVQISAVHIPPMLDRRQMVTQSGPHAVQLSDRDRWSAPLGDMARRVLSQDLQSRLPEGTVVVPGMPTTTDTGRIVVSILQFGPEGSGKAILVGSWSLSSGTGDVLSRHDVSLSTPLSGSGANAAAAAMSDLLGQLATEMAAELAR
jgi:uncharacterized lipoprotein YmbA